MLERGLQNITHTVEQDKGSPSLLSILPFPLLPVRVLYPFTLTMLPALPILAGLAAVASAAPITTRQQTCYSGLYMIVARGSNEAAGEGKPGQVADMIAAQVADSASIAVDYPATIIGNGPAYPESVVDGINDTKTKIQDYVNACGSASRIVLLGYSQGGNVMTDVLAGGVDKPDPIGDDLKQYSKCSPHGLTGIESRSER